MAPVETHAPTEPIDAQESIFQAYLAGRIDPDSVRSAHAVSMQYLENDPDTLTAQEAIKAHGGVDLHRHLEGMLTAIDLYEIAEEIGGKLGFSVQFRDETWEKIFAKMNGVSLDGKKLAPFESFLGMLATFAVRGIYENAMLQGKCLIDERKTAYALEFISETVIKTVFERALSKAHKEGIGVLDLMASPLAMTAEGNLFDYAVNEFPGIDELDQIAGAWQMRTKVVQGNAQIPRDTLLTTRRYVELFNTVIGEQSDMYRQWNEDMRHGNDNRMRVGLRLCFRREQLPELDLIHNHAFTDNRVHRAAQYVFMVRQLMDQRNISGINIGGDESRTEKTYYLRNYSLFLESFLSIDGSITVHAGETTEANADAAYDNLEYAVRHLKVERIGHAMRLFDRAPRMRSLLADMIFHPDIYPTVIEANVFSNFMLGLVRSLEEHPILTHDAELKSWGVLFYNFIRNRLVFTTDDPNISEGGKSFRYLRWLYAFVPEHERENFRARSTHIHSSNCALAKELALIQNYSNLFDHFGGIEEYIRHQIARWQ